MKWPIGAVTAPPHVVVVGGGFAGLNAARRLAGLPVRVTLVDRQNHHLFQPLLYQVATAALSAPDVAVPIRRILRRQRNATVLLGEVTSIDVEARTVELDGVERVPTTSSSSPRAPRPPTSGTTTGGGTRPA